MKNQNDSVAEKPNNITIDAADGSSCARLADQPDASLGYSGSREQRAASDMSALTGTTAREGDDEEGLYEGVDEVTRLLQQLVSSITSLQGSFGRHACSFMSSPCCKPQGRIRDIFPMCRIQGCIDFTWPPDWSDARRTAVIDFGNLSLSGLSFLYGDAQLATAGPPTSLQLTVQRCLLEKLVIFTKRLDAHEGCLSCQEAFASLVGRASLNKYPPLDADRVDLLDACGTMDPNACLAPEEAAIVCDAERMFPNGVGEVSRAVTFRGGPRSEYINLLQRQLRARKVGLVKQANAIGGTFAVGKKALGRQREVWDGSELSQAAVPPPKPPLQADPASLVHMECSQDRPLWLSQRDAEVWFDQLKLPVQLSPYMGRPRVAVKELLQIGFGRSEIQSYLLNNEEFSNECMLIPVNLTWAMGFSWSSFIAQSTMVESCCSAGFPRECFLKEAGELPSPLVAHVCGNLAVATDDVSHFLRASKVQVKALDLPPLALLDHSWQAKGIRPQQRKSCDLKLNGTVLGIDFVHGTHLSPNLQGLVAVLCAGVDLFRSKVASPPGNPFIPGEDSMV